MPAASETGVSCIGGLFVLYEQLHTLAAETRAAPLAVAAACLAWTADATDAAHRAMNCGGEEVLVAIEDASGVSVVRLGLGERCTLTLHRLVADADAQLSAAATNPSELQVIAQRVAVAVSTLDAPRRPLDAALSLSLLARGGAQLCFDSSCIDCETANGLAVRIGACASAPPDGLLADVPLMPAAEVRFVAAGCNRTKAPTPPETTVHAAFVAAAAARPACVALRDAAGMAATPALTYGDLDACSDALAADLLDLTREELRPDRRLVALLFVRSPAMVVAILGVLKAGAGYLPIEPAYPAARARQVLDEANPPAALIEASLEAQPAATALHDAAGESLRVLRASVDGKLTPVETSSARSSSNDTMPMGHLPKTLLPTSSDDVRARRPHPRRLPRARMPRPLRAASPRMRVRGADGLRHVHVGLDGQAQGRRRDARAAAQAHQLAPPRVSHRRGRRGAV